MKRLLFIKNIIFLAAVISIGLLILLTEFGCKEATSPGFEKPVMDEYFFNIIFSGIKYSDVTFKHNEHSDRYNGSCFQCHNCEDNQLESKWNCRSCHKSQDPEARCGISDEFHGCTYVQCDYCHNTLQANPGHNCLYCHPGGAKNGPTVNPVLEKIDFDLVKLTFNKAIDQNSSEIEDNYFINGTGGLPTTPTNAYRENNVEVVLTVGDMTGLNPGETVIVTVTGVKDTDGNEISDINDSNVAIYIENNLPEALNVGLSGNLILGSTLTASYTYYDAEDDPEGNPILQWYRCNDSSCTSEVLILTTACVVSGSGAGSVVDGTYEYNTAIITDKSDGQYSDLGMPVYRKSGTDYYIGYRGCYTKWVILELPAGPTSYHIGAGPGYGYIYHNLLDSYLVPETGWLAGGSSSDHGTPGPGPTVTRINGSLSYTLISSDVGKYIKFKVIPFAMAGNSPGDPQSIIVGPITNP